MPVPAVSVVTALRVQLASAPTAARAVTAVMPAPWVPVVRRVPVTVVRRGMTVLVPTAVMVATVVRA
jgi:hypothetical protein